MEEVVYRQTHNQNLVPGDGSGSGILEFLELSSRAGEEVQSGLVLLLVGSPHGSTLLLEGRDPDL